jgi:hypothetical protein
LRQAKEDLDAARKGREKLTKAKAAAQEETERLETQVARAEAQASAAQEALFRTRRYVSCPLLILISASTLPSPPSLPALGIWRSRREEKLVSEQRSKRSERVLKRKEEEQPQGSSKKALRDCNVN